MDKKTRDAIGEAVAKGLLGVEAKLETMTQKVDGLCTSMGTIETRLSTLESQLQGVNDLVETAVAKEVSTATSGIRDDITTLELKMGSVQQQLADIKDTDVNKEKECTSVIIRNLALEDDNKLLEEVKDIFISVLEISVHIVSADRYKTHSKKSGPIKVQLTSRDEVTLVMSNKSKLMDYENLDKVHIEAFMTKAEVITRDNWNTVIRLLGNAGKGVRVAGTGRIVRKAEKGERRPQAGESAAGGDMQGQPTTPADAAVSGTSGGPPIPGAKPLSQRKKKRKKRRTTPKNGTNDSNNSDQVAPLGESAKSDTAATPAAVTTENGTNTHQQEHEMATSPDGGQSGDEYVVVSAPVQPAAEPENKQQSKGDAAGPKTRARTQKSLSTDNDKTEEEDEGHKSEESETDTISPIKKSINAIHKKIWSHKTK